MFGVREQDLNYHQVEKLKNEMISRQDDEDVLDILQEGETKKSVIFELPLGAGQFYSSSALFVAYVPNGTHHFSTP